MPSLNYLKNMCRYGVRFALRDTFFAKKKLNKLCGNHQLTLEDLNNFQAKMLYSSLKYAINNIPAYFKYDIPNFNNFDPADLIRQFPIINKNKLISGKSDFYPGEGKKKPYWSLGKTSGTTGTPLEIFRSYSSVLYENVFIRRHWELSGFQNGDNRATMRGDLIVPIGRNTPPYWFFNYFDNQLLISSRHLRSGCFKDIADKLENFSPHILEAYPSTAYELAKYLEQENRILKIPFVYTGSEILYDYQRELISERFSCKVMDFYGMAERVAFASECIHGNLHLNSDYSYVEILDKENNPTNDNGYITGTTFHNLAMPLVRYQLSDITKRKKGKCSCGSVFPMIEPIQGKFEDIVYGGEDAPISPSVLTFAFKGLSNIRKSQVAQVEQHVWEVRIVPENCFSDEDKNMLINNIHQLVDPLITVKVKMVDDIPRESSGKYRWVVNEWRNIPI